MRLNEVAEINDKINESIKEIECTRVQHDESASQNTAVDALFLFYFKNLVPSHL